MNSTNLRYTAAALQLVIGLLAIFKLVDATQATSAIALVLAAYHVAQGQLTPDTNQRTPDDAPPAGPKSGATPAVRQALCVLLMVGLFAGCLSGCASVGKNLATFVNNLPPNTLTDASQTTQSPIYSHTESVTGMSKSPDGTIVITNLKAALLIPLWGFSDQLSVSGLTIAPGTAPIAVVTK